VKYNTTIITQHQCTLLLLIGIFLGIDSTTFNQLIDRTRKLKMNIIRMSYVHIRVINLARMSQILHHIDIILVKKQHKNI
jgi:hypothetical protein